MVLGLGVVLVVAATVVFTLFVRQQDLPEPEPVSPVKHLEERKAAIYDNLRDLQFEYRVGKLSDADYQQTKIGLQKELAGVIAEIDKVMAGKAASPAPVEPPNPPAPLTDAPVRCPQCSSTQVHAEKSGWKWTSGILGGGKIVITCLRCGFRFPPGKGA